MTANDSCAPGPAAPALLIRRLLAGPDAAAQQHYTGTGRLLRAGPPGPDGVLPLQVQPLMSDYELGFGHPCRLQARLHLRPGTGEGHGSFGLHTPMGGLLGEFSAVLLPVGEFGGWELSSVVRGGSGAFAGVSGEALSVLTLRGPASAFPLPFSEAGFCRLHRGAAAPWARAWDRAPPRAPPRQQPRIAWR